VEVTDIYYILTVSFCRLCIIAVYCNFVLFTGFIFFVSLCLGHQIVPEAFSSGCSAVQVFMHGSACEH